MHAPSLRISDACLRWSGRSGPFLRPTFFSVSPLALPLTLDSRRALTAAVVGLPTADDLVSVCLRGCLRDTGEVGERWGEGTVEGTTEVVAVCVSIGCGMRAEARAAAAVMGLWRSSKS